MNNNLKILEKYYKSLPKLPRGQHRLVAGIWEKNKLISLGFNQLKTHPYQKQTQEKINPTRQFLHAEIHALIQAFRVPSWSPERSTMIVYRETRGGIPATSRPCEGCSEALRLAGVRRVLYMDDEGFIKTL
jgi:tRNA(Arg) A34 adenosine deaminase TadA